MKLLTFRARGISTCAVLALALATAAPVAAAGPCVAGTLTSYAALGPSGCTVSGTTFGSFTALSSINGATSVPPGNVTVTPTTSGGPSLTFQLSASAGANTIEETRFSYQVSGGTVSASAISVTGTSSSGNGAVTEIQDFCLNGVFDASGVTNCTGSAGLLVVLASGSNQAAFAPVASVTVTNDFTFDAGGNGTATGGTLTNQFTATGSVCSYTVTPASQNVITEASTQTVTVTTAAGCSWQAVSNVPWIVITAGAGGIGTGTVTYTVQSNTTSSPRTGTLTIAGQTITVNQGAPISSATGFVTALYQDLLNRAPDTSGLNFYVNQLNTGAITRSQLASQFFTSNEFSGTGLYIIKLYLAVLRRDPDFAGWSYWFNAVGSGMPTFTVLQAFLSSNEFQSQYGNLSNQDFVTLVYQNVLGRAPDAGGLAYYVGLLNAGTLTRAGLMDQFIRSAEYNTFISPRAYADLLYLGFLRRSADPVGLAYWTGILANQSNLPIVIGSFVTSQEYLARF